MIRNFKLTLEYEGTHFNGWQTQAAGFRTIQSHLEEKLERIFKEKINVQASGRTDSGVHALAQVAHFKVNTDIKSELIQKALNSFLDRDLSVIKVEDVPLNFHAQKSVKNKTYRYTILNRDNPSALWRDRAYYYPHKLNLALMRKAAQSLKGTHDFKSFQTGSQRSRIKNTVRTILKLSIIKEGDLIHISITADGFLHKMVRIIVGSLVAIGSGKLPADTMSKILSNKDRKLSPSAAPSHGLCLVSVRY